MDGLSNAQTQGNDTTRLTFEKVRAQVDVTFWMELRQRKLNEWKLREPVVPLVGTPTAFVALADTATRLPSAATDATDIVFSRESFVSTSRSGERSAAARLTTPAPDATFLRATVPGELRNINVLADLTNLNTTAALFTVLRERLLGPLLLDVPAPAAHACGRGTESLEDEEAALWRTAPFLYFTMFVYVDAKNYDFHHREAFPVMSVDSPVFVDTATTPGETGVSPLVATTMERHGVARARAYGAACLYSPFLCVVSSSPAEEKGEEVSFAEFSPTRLARLTREAAHTPGKQVVVCFRDLATSASSDATTLGWPMRNFLLCLRLALPLLTRVTLYALREHGRSQCLPCICEPLADGPAMVAALRASGASGPPPLFLHVTGWRKTSVHVANTSTHMNPVSLAEEGSRLNLELMKWRQLPSLDLDGLRGCRALLLGAGTLGCNVARGLLMWGVRHITLVDRGTVHYSNLARQSLFTAADASQRSREKTVAAAAALRAIIPSVVAEPVTMTIHMPGHRTDPAQAAQTRAEVERLAELIRGHDVVFLLTDSWEARWLPTVLATAHDTPLINVALGFDSYVVMRHGLTGSDVRCYFCSDVAAPTDSLTARALDQQCTVTRPGVSGVASALAVELLAAMYQQSPPLGECVAAHSRLGVVPEQIRGTVFTHETMLLTGKRNPNCTACSRSIVEAYEREGNEFLLRCINEPSHIENVSGLGASKALWEAQNDAADWSCHSSSSCSGGGE